MLGSACLVRMRLSEAARRIGARTTTHLHINVYAAQPNPTFSCSPPPAAILGLEIYSSTGISICSRLSIAQIRSVSTSCEVSSNVSDRRCYHVLERSSRNTSPQFIHTNDLVARHMRFEAFLPQDFLVDQFLDFGCEHQRALGLTKNKRNCCITAGW